MDLLQCNLNLDKLQFPHKSVAHTVTLVKGKHFYVLFSFLESILLLIFGDRYMSLSKNQQYFKNCDVVALYSMARSINSLEDTKRQCFNSIISSLFISWTTKRNFCSPWEGLGDFQLFLISLLSHCFYLHVHGG